MLKQLRLVLIMLVSISSHQAKASGSPTFFMTVFGAESAISLARNSHTFATFVKVENGTITEEGTISWLPAPGYFMANFTMPLLRVVPGHNYTLDETVQLSPGRRVHTFGPYQIEPELYRRAVNRMIFLSQGTTSYKMMMPFNDSLRQPTLHNMPGGAINCIMAVSDLGGMLNTGTSWGDAASRQVVQLLAPMLVHQDYTVDDEVAALMKLNARLQLPSR